MSATYSGSEKICAHTYRGEREKEKDKANVAKLLLPTKSIFVQFSQLFFLSEIISK